MKGTFAERPKKSKDDLKKKKKGKDAKVLKRLK
jgi:hypothetical protein